jgi:hypothetical protein
MPLIDLMSDHLNAAIGADADEYLSDADSALLKLRARLRQMPVSPDVRALDELAETAQVAVASAFQLVQH